LVWADPQFDEPLLQVNEGENLRGNLRINYLLLQIRVLVCSAFIIALTFGCKAKDQSKDPGSSPVPDIAAPIKTETKSSHKRLFFSFKNCKWDSITFLGYIYVDSFKQINPPNLDPAMAGKFVKVELLNGVEEVVYLTYIINQQDMDSPRKDFELTDCRFDFFVDVPKEIDPKAVKGAKFSVKGHHPAFIPFLISTEIEPSAMAKIEANKESPIDISKIPHRVIPLHRGGSADESWDVVFAGGWRDQGGNQFRERWWSYKYGAG
jgi:hypothetical protein